MRVGLSRPRGSFSGRQSCIYLGRFKVQGDCRIMELGSEKYINLFTQHILMEILINCSFVFLSVPRFVMFNEFLLF